MGLSITNARSVGEKDMYKINLHSHSKYSDGSEMMSTMAQKAKELGFTCYVVTDHHYGSNRVTSQYDYVTSSPLKFNRQKREAKDVALAVGIPVVVGMEFNFAGKGEEMVVIGTEAIDYILQKGQDGEDINPGMIRYIKKNFKCLVILVHPHLRGNGDDICFIENSGIHDSIDAFETYNRGCAFFKNREIPDYLKGKVELSNSDTHWTGGFEAGWNETEEPLTTEEEIIDYILAKKPVKTVIKDPDPFALMMEE